MKREQIVKRIIETAQTFNAIAEVYTSGEMYPKCYLAEKGANINGWDRIGKRLSPNMLPTHLLAYVQGMVAGKKD